MPPEAEALPAANTPPASTTDLGLTRTQRASLLAIASTERVMAVADTCLADVGQPTLISGPEVGTIVLTVREPVESTRFHLGEVLVTRVELVHRDVPGWAMRMGDDPAGAVAAAICDAEAAADGGARDLIDALCATTAAEQQLQRDTEWSELEPTIVRFEELS